MKQTTKTLVGLVALVLVAGAVGGVAYWTDKDETQKTEAKEKSEKLFDFDKAKVKEVRIEKDGKPAVQVVKADKGWRLALPVQADADDNTVDSLLNTLTGLKQKKDLGDEKDLKSYGLDAPKLAVIVKLDDGKEQGVRVGVDNSFDNTLYVQKVGDPVVRIVDGYVKSNLDRSPFDLRNKLVAHLDPNAEVKSIEVTGTKSPYSLTRVGGSWKLDGASAADTGAADRIVSAIKSLKATAIAAESAAIPGEFGLDIPKATVKIGTASGTRTIQIGQARAGATAQKTYAKRDDSPVIYEVDAQIVKDLDKEPFDLQDKSLVHADKEAVKELDFEGPAGTVKISRSKPTPPDGGFAEETFAVVAPKPGPAKKWKASAALYSFTSLRAASFEGAIPAQKDLAKYGLDKPKTASLLGEGGKVLARVRIGAEKDGKRWVIADGIDKLARVEKGTVDDWPWTASDALEAPAKPQASK
jgi:predicted ribosomally synthesized peptide with SipW-like signal peptide